MASPLLLGRLYTRVSEPSGRRAKRRSPADRQFCDERIRDGFSGFLWTAGAVFTRCCSHAATAYARSCQAKSAGETPLPPTASSKSEAVCTRVSGRASRRRARAAWDRPPDALRSEEHTSELQSHSDLVCRLLLEKKK